MTVLWASAADGDKTWSKKQVNSRASRKRQEKRTYNFCGPMIRFPSRVGVERGEMQVVRNHSGNGARGSVGRAVALVLKYVPNGLQGVENGYRSVHQFEREYISINSSPFGKLDVHSDCGEDMKISQNWKGWRPWWEVWFTTADSENNQGKPDKSRSSDCGCH